MLAVAGFLVSMPLSAYEFVGCPGDTDSQQPPAEFEPCNGDGCASTDSIRTKRNLHNWFYWAVIDPVFNTEVFKVYTHHSYISWSYNLTRQSIRWIDKWGWGECQTPVGSCESLEAKWTTEVCDRDGNDTCLFRRQNQGHASFTYGVLFNKYMKSCLGTRINWDGSHQRNKWEGDCEGSAAAAEAVSLDRTLTLGAGKNEVPVGRYLSGPQMRSLEEACFQGASASVRECKQVALRLYRTLPPDAQRKLRPAACAALSPRALKRLHPGTQCERRAS